MEQINSKQQQLFDEAKQNKFENVKNILEAKQVLTKFVIGLFQNIKQIFHKPCRHRVN